MDSQDPFSRWQNTYKAFLEAVQATSRTNTDADRRTRHKLREEASRLKEELSDMDFLHANRWEKAEHARLFPEPIPHG